MKRVFSLLILTGFVTLFVVSCQKKELKEQNKSDAVPLQVLSAIKEMGFSPNGVLKRQGGYLVEGDIFIPESELGKKIQGQALKTTKTEQYRTTELVTGWPRIINVYVSGLNSNYNAAVDDAIGRYNNLHLGLTFNRIGTSSGAHITISGFYEVSTTFAMSGFPSGGNPYPSVSLNTYYFFQGVNTASWAASVIQHELGHCIGMRHTDYMDRSFSCFSGGNEGASTVGAIQIPNTPSTPETESWMLACIDQGAFRSFTTYDILALSYLYSPGQIPPAASFFEWAHVPNGDHILSTNANTSNLISGLTYVGPSQRVFITDISGTVPLYEFYHSGNKDHWYSANINATSGYSGWQNTGIVGYVYLTQVSGSVPVYEYYNSSTTDHRYTTFSLNSPGFVYQGIAYYAMPQ